MNQAPDTRWLVIVNPVSNRGATAERIDAIKGVLSQCGISFDLKLTRQKNHAFDLAAEGTGQYGVIVAVGGDGTVHEIVNGLFSRRNGQSKSEPLPTIGIIPSGSGNDFVKTLGIPADVYQSVQIILKGQTRAVDIGRITIDGEDRGLFHNNVGTGFDAHVNYENSRIKAVRGLAGYLSAVMKTIFKYKHPHVTLKWDGGSLDKAVLLVNTGIGRCSGGGFYLTPDAVLDDGLFDICIIESLKKLKILKELPKALDGSHTKLKEVTMFRTTSLEIESEQGLPVHADGEMLSMNAQSVKISMAEKQMTVIRGN